MPSAISLATMIGQVQNRANLQNLQTNVAVADIRDFLNECTCEIYDLLVAARGNEYFRKSCTLTTMANVSSYPLPSDFYELISVDIVLAPNQIIGGQLYNEDERNKFRYFPGWFYQTPIYFRILGSPQSAGAVLQQSTINFIPYPNATTAFQLNYIPVFRKWATDGSEDQNVFDGVNGWEAGIVWGAVAMALEKLELDSSFATQKYEETKERLEGMATDRMAGQADRVQDRMGDRDVWPFGVT